MKRLYNFLILILLFVPPLLFFTDLTRNPYYIQITLLNSLTLILWIIWLAKGFVSKKIACPKTVIDLPLLSFLAVATISLLVSLLTRLRDPYLPYSIFSEGSKRWLFLVVNEILAFYAAYTFTDDSNRGKFISITFWAGFIASIYGILQYFGIELIWPHTLNPFGGRSVSTFGNPNFLSSYIVLLFPLALSRYLFKNKFSPVYFVLLITFFSAVLCTLTRSSWAGIFIGSAFFIVILLKYDKKLIAKKVKPLCVLLAVFALMVFFWPKSKVAGYNPTVTQRLVETTEAQNSYYGPWHQRMLIWSCAWDMVKDNPILGKGWGCFELYYPSYQGKHLFIEAYRNFRTHANNAHNEILEVWSQTGTIGFGIYIWFIIVLLRYGFSVTKEASGEKRIISAALICSITGMLVDNLLNVSINFPIPGFLYWWNAGLLAAYFKKN